MSDEVTVTFEGLSIGEIIGPRARRTKAGTRTRLSNGLWHIQTSPVRPYSEIFKCYTRDYAVIAAIKTKIGIFGNLVVDDPTDPVDLRNVAITGDINEDPEENGWNYEIEFTQGV